MVMVGARRRGRYRAPLLAVTLGGGASLGGAGEATVDAAGETVRADPLAARMSAVQGWVAMRVRSNWASASAPNAYLWLFVLNAGDITERIQFGYQRPDRWYSDRASAGGGSGSGPVAELYTFVAGVPVSMIFAWTATALLISTNGAAFASAGNTAAPTQPTRCSLLYDLETANREWMGTAYWYAFGAGTLTDADAAMIAALGDAGPRRVGQLPGGCIAIWRPNSLYLEL